MWRRNEEPKASPSPQNVVVTPPVQEAPAQLHPSHHPIAQPEPPKPAVSVITKGISIRGQVTGTEDLQINGELHGSVKLAGGRVTIGTDGNVSGDIDAREIVVRGELKGNLRAADRILVGPTGRWNGDSVSPRLVIEEGAVVSGKLEVATPAEKKQGRTGTNGSNGSTHTAPVEVPLAIGADEKES
ncbi:MAG TPA: polymer-forming cytoskeletal protein [Candidatus Acidoferrum sp.]|nr:polymer-forming cytoskeletal protein [Candidatus Acidoferrum sp.]